MRGVLRRLTVAAAVVLLPSTVAAQELYTIDTSHSDISFTVRHLGVSNVRGSFGTVSGQITLDENDITKSSVNVTIDAASIDTEHERRDNDLRSEGFFDVAKYPNITFRSTRVEKSGAELVLVGELTMKDVTKEVRIPFEMTGPLVSANGQKRIGATGSLRVNRFDYNLRWNNLREAVPIVGDEVRIDLSVGATTPRPAR